MAEDTATDKAVEVMARAICVAMGDDPDREGPWEGWFAISPYAREAQAALAAYHTHLAERGLVIVPEVPTEAMLDAAKMERG